MKKFAIALIFILLLATTSAASNFVEIVRDDNIIIYVDADSIKDNNNYVSAWSKWIFRGDFAKEFRKRYYKTAQYTMSYSAYDKNEKQSQSLAYVVYNNKGGVINSTNHQFDQYKWEFVTPQSYGEAVYDYVLKSAGY